MGIVQKDALRVSIISYLGLVIGYLNKGLLFIWFLTTEEIGLLNLLVAVGLLFGNLSGLGSSYAIWKFFPFLHNRERKHYGFLSLILLVSLIGGVIFSLLTIIFHDEIAGHYSKSVLFVENYYWIIPVGIANLLYIVFDGFLKSLYNNVVSVLAYELLLRILIFLLLLGYGAGLIGFDTLVTVNCLLYFVPVLVLGWYMKNKRELHLSIRSIEVPKRFRRIIFSFSLFSYINSVGGLFVITIDAMMVASMLGLEATGVYTTVIYLTSALQVPYKSMLRIGSPLIAKYWKERNMTEMNSLYKKFSSVNLVISTTAFLLVWICREELFDLLGPEYHEGIWVFLFLMVGRMTDMYLGLNGVIFATSKKYRYDLFFTLLLIVIVWGLNLWLIPVYGITGSAIATAVALLIYNIGRMVFVYVVYKLHPFVWSQAGIVALFSAVVCFFEYISLPIHGLAAVPVKWLLLGLLFLLPIYIFRMEMEIVGYVNKVLGIVRTRVTGLKR